MRREGAAISSGRVLLLDDRFDPDRGALPARGTLLAVACLYWIEPAAAERLSARAGAPCHGLDQIAGSVFSWGRAAFELASSVVESGPLYRGLPVRTYLTEGLYREAFVPELMRLLASWLESQRLGAGLSELVVEGSLRPADESMLRRSLEGSPNLRYEQSGGGSTRPLPTVAERDTVLGRWRSRLGEARATTNWRRFLQEFVEAADRTGRLRAGWSRRRPVPVVRRGEVVFFSSYENNTRTLASVAGDMPLPVTWLLANRSAQRGLPLASVGVSLWRFAGREPPEAGEASESVDPSAPPSDDALHVREWLEQSAAWRSWRWTESRLVAVLTACWERFLDRASPRLVVTANQWGIEGWLALLAQRRGIPVLQLAHGVVGGHLYTRTPVLSDALVVWGDFWRRLWPAGERQKILVYNPRGLMAPIARRPGSGRPRLTFFSWPLSQLRFYNEVETLNALLPLLHRLLERGCRLRIRAHPLENPAGILALWRARFGPPPPHLTISKARPLEADLAETDLALMFRSTVLLRCLVSGIPVVMPGWMDFGWSERLEPGGGIFAAPDFARLEDRLTAWLEEPARVDHQAQDLVAPPGGGREAFRELVEDLISGRSG